MVFFMGEKYLALAFQNETGFRKTGGDMTDRRKPALIIIDPQLDYFPGYRFPLWNTKAVLNNILEAIEEAKRNRIPVILVQYLADSEIEPVPFFEKGSLGAGIHPEIRNAARTAPVVVKNRPDSFFRTDLEKALSARHVNHLVLCGMMTHNCVTHTALSPTAGKYTLSVLSDCCTTVNETMHEIALNAISTYAPLTTRDIAFLQ